MQFFRRELLLIAAATALASCEQFVGSCSWLEPEGNPALKIVEARKPISGECDCINCDAPGRFQIQRDDYTLEIWNGDRSFAEFYVRARSRDGAILDLSADTPELVRMAPHVPASATHGYEYFMRVGRYDSPPQSLSISVVQPDGHVLGVESIRLRKEARRVVGVEYP